ncbi:MAG TPA: lipid-binding SYLF domain-containing protein [Candidatus Polarisedimenticolia bacterium]|nr:lipid-binding SYLF domain-containing protein [Candidatus Polarisedimenticolia bacterium]
MAPRALILTTLIAGLGAGPFPAGETEEAKVLRAAAEVMQRSVEPGSDSIPAEVLAGAACVGVFPASSRAGLAHDDKRRKGALSCRAEDGSMGPPAFFTVTEPRALRRAASDADLVLVIPSREALRPFLEGRFKAGGDKEARTAARAPRGPASVPDAPILSWRHREGDFEEASLESSVIEPDAEANRRFYGKPASPREILIERSVPVPPSS